MSEDLPEPETPVTTTNFPRGTAHVEVLEVVLASTTDDELLAVAGAAGFGVGSGAAGEVGAGDALVAVEDGGHSPFGDDVAAVAAGLRPRSMM